MKKILLSLTLLGSTVVNAQLATNDTPALTNNVQCVWNTNQALGLKALWREEIADSTNPPVFATWAANKVKAELAEAVALWEAQRAYRVRAAKEALLARLAACEPNAAQWATISNVVVTAEAARIP